MIVEIDDEIVVHEDFCWLTLYQLKKLIKLDNLINMDSRSVISCIPFSNEKDFIYDFLINNATNNHYEIATMKSIVSKDALHTIDEIIGWLTSEKVAYYLNIETIPLKEVKDWQITSNEIRHKNDNRFSIVALKVTANNREVASWTQPILKDLKIGLIGFLIKTINNIDHYLVQAKIEPGNIDFIDLAPTVSCSNYHQVEKMNRDVKFLDLFLDGSKSDIKYDHLQSEEGGRFYFYQNRYMIAHLKDDTEIAVPRNYKWMTLGQILELSKHGYFNIEARGLLACIDFCK